MAAEIVARLLGAFYAFGGIMVMRSLTMDDFLDKAIAAIEGQPRPVNTGLNHWIGGIIGLLTGVSGAALALLSAMAVPLFGICLALQAIWFLAEPRLLAVADQSDARGRSRSRNAMISYALATAFVLYLWHDARLAPWDSPLSFSVLALGLALSFWLAKELLWTMASNVSPSPVSKVGPIKNAYLMPGGPARILLDPGLGDMPLHDADTGVDFDHFELLSGNLAEQIEIWSRDYRRWFNAKIDEEDHDYVVDQIRQCGEAIAAALHELLGADNVEGPVYEDLFPR